MRKGRFASVPRGNRVSMCASSMTLRVPVPSNLATTAWPICAGVSKSLTASAPGSLSSTWAPSAASWSPMSWATRSSPSLSRLPDSMVTSWRSVSTTAGFSFCTSECTGSTGAPTAAPVRNHVDTANEARAAVRTANLMLPPLGLAGRFRRTLTGMSLTLCSAALLRRSSMLTRCSRPIFFMLVRASRAARADAPAPATDVYLDKTRPRWEQTSRQIWEFAETGLEETRSSALLADVLTKEGFKVQRGVAGMPTAFVATAGSGAPVVAILAEYDALPGLSQKAPEAQKDPLTKAAPRHGCGHNLLGTAAVAAAVAANQSRIEKKLPGTIQVFGTPAEEVISAAAKTFMLKARPFHGTHAVLSLHPLPTT